jgi:hypothetical protein
MAESIPALVVPYIHKAGGLLGKILPPFDAMRVYGSL